MITGLLWLLGCQFVGEVVVRLLGIPVPGPVLGMLVLFAVLAVRRPAAEAAIFRTSDALLKHLQLFFVPAGVGVVVYGAVLRDDAVPIVVALVGSWLLGMAVVGWVVSWLLPRGAREAGQSGRGR